MQADDCADEQQVPDLPPTEPDLAVPHRSDTEKSPHCCDQAPPCDQHRRADGGEATEDGRRRENDDEKVELEARADARSFVSHKARWKRNPGQCPQAANMKRI